MADKILEPLRKEVDRLGYYQVRPCLATVVVGEDEASKIYVRKKREAARKVGVKVQEFQLPGDVGREEVLRKLGELNLSGAFHGILLQLPLPAHLCAHELELCNAVDPRKDVDGFTARNLGAAVQKQPAHSMAHTAFYPCTPLAVARILLSIAASREEGGADMDEPQLRDTFAGGRAVVLGRSHNVGAPVALLLMADVAKGGFDMTTTVCHRASSADSVAASVRAADVVVSAVGRPGLISADMVKPGAIVLDVGISRVAGEGGKTRVVGDVDPQVAEVASYLTPVPGGVGPCTVACLIHNVVLAAKRSLHTSSFF